MLSYIVISWSKSIWCHTGIAYRDISGKLWVLEAANYAHPHRGVFRIPFETWTYINRSSHLGIIRYTGDIFPVKELEREFIRYEGVSELDTFNLTWMRFLKTREYVDETIPRDKYTCYELTVMILQKIGVVKRELLCSSYTPGDVAWNRLPYQEGHSYAPVIGFVLPLLSSVNTQKYEWIDHKS